MFAPRWLGAFEGEDGGVFGDLELLVFGATPSGVDALAGRTRVVFGCALVGGVLIWAIGANLSIFAFGLVVAKPEAFGALHEGGRWGVRRLAFG
jgi:hypothetical protein